jgi:amino acid transporter
MGPAAYKKNLGLRELVSLGVGGTIGSGIFVVPGIAAGIAGPYSLVAWFIVAISASAVLWSLAALIPHFQGSGSFYSLFTSVFGEKIGDPVILCYLFSSIVGISTIAAGIGQYISYFGQMDVVLIEIIAIALLLVVNIIGVRLSGMTENVLTILKIVPLVIIALFLLPYVRFGNFAPTVPFTFGALFSTIIIVYWPFTGFEISAIPDAEARDITLIRRSLFFVMIIVVGIYLLLNAALIGSVGSVVLAASPAPVATAAALFYAQSGPVIALVGIVAMLSAMNAYIIGSSRILQYIAERRTIPVLRILSHRGTPDYALLAGCGASGTLLLISNHFAKLASLSVITTLVPYVFFCIAAWILITDAKSRAIAAIGALTTVFILISSLFF